jgi:hypothetical protein
MRLEAVDMTSDSDRTAIDRHAVTAAAQLLISAIWLEHRVRRFSTRFSMSPSQRASVLPVVSSSASHETDRALRVRDGRGDWPTPHQEKGATQ